MAFPGIFGDIPRNVWLHSLKCLMTFPGIFGNIPTFPAFPAFRSPFLYSWFYTQPANSANTKRRSFHVKINCSKFRIDRLQQLCHVIFLIYLFVISRNYYCYVKENYYNLMKNSRKFQANVTERHSSLSKRSRMFRQNLLKVCTCEKVESLEAHYCTCAPSQVIFKLYVKIVFAPIY